MKAPTNVRYASPVRGGYVYSSPTTTHSSGVEQAADKGCAPNGVTAHSHLL